MINKKNITNTRQILFIYEELQKHRKTTSAKGLAIKPITFPCKLLLRSVKNAKFPLSIYRLYIQSN